MFMSFPNAYILLGNHITIYGLAVEHTVQDLVVWKGKHGHVYFYQSELPYDVCTENYGQYSGYRVEDSAEGHVAVGHGVYSFFRDHECDCITGIQSLPPDAAFTNPFTVRLKDNYGIANVLNDRGGGPSMQTDGEVVYI